MFMRQRALVPVTVVLMMLPAACGRTASDDVPTEDAPSSGPVTDCGTFELSQGERPPETAVRCLVDAVEARIRARLKVTRPTVEGDPIPVTYVTHADGSVEVITDARQDKFGSGDIQRMTCVRPSLTPDGPDFAECSEPAP